MPYVNYYQVTPSINVSGYGNFTFSGMHPEPTNMMHLHGQPQMNTQGHTVFFPSHEAGMSHQQAYHQQPQYQQPNQQHPFVVHSHNMHGFQAPHSGYMVPMPPQMSGRFQLMASQ
jgi:hypothetical protein